ncbi:MAG: methylated-DNA--[protein]-cysteine S-methyltransferase [Acidimicrobiales bacterium]
MSAIRIRFESPIGVCTLEGDDDGIDVIELPGRSTSRSVERHAGRVAHLPKALDMAVQQLTEYFDGERHGFDVPLHVGGTPFQRDVWLALADIPYGSTVSYGELAAQVGRPTAFRAVGQANGANRLPIVLPCHRVLAAHGRIGGYGGGLDMKRKLLALEGVDLGV